MKRSIMAVVAILIVVGFVLLLSGGNMAPASITQTESTPYGINQQGLAIVYGEVWGSKTQGSEGFGAQKIEGALISLKSLTTTLIYQTRSDVLGRFHFDQVRPDAYLLHIMSASYKIYCETITVSEGMYYINAGLTAR